MELPTDPVAFRAAGEHAAEVREAAYKSYSLAASVVRERAKELDDALHRGGIAEAIDRRREALAVAVHMKDLAEHESDAADRNWQDWLDEYRSRREDARLERQSATARSAMWAAWAAGASAFLSFAVAIWQVFGSMIRAALHR